MAGSCGREPAFDVPGVRFELTRPCGQRVLSPPRLPFRHPGRAQGTSSSPAVTDRARTSRERRPAGPVVVAEVVERLLVERVAAQHVRPRGGHDLVGERPGPPSSISGASGATMQPRVSCRYQSPSARDVGVGHLAAVLDHEAAVLEVVDVVDLRAPAGRRGSRSRSSGCADRSSPGSSCTRSPRGAPRRAAPRARRTSAGAVAGRCRTRTRVVAAAHDEADPDRGRDEDDQRGQADEDQLGPARVASGR